MAADLSEKKWKMYSMISNIIISMGFKVISMNRDLWELDYKYKGFGFTMCGHLGKDTLS